jgi:predicted acyl esterase
MVFDRGHRLRISVSGSNSPRFEVNPNHGGDLNGNEPGVAARPQIMVGPDSHSRLVLPDSVTEPRRSRRRESMPNP